MWPQSNSTYIKKTLASSYLTSGPVCEKAERLLKIKFKKKYAILTNSWTNGLITILGLYICSKKSNE